MKANLGLLWLSAALICTAAARHLTEETQNVTQTDDRKALEAEDTSTGALGCGCCGCCQCARNKTADDVTKALESDAGSNKTEAGESDTTEDRKKRELLLLKPYSLNEGGKTHHIQVLDNDRDQNSMFIFVPGNRDEVLASDALEETSRHLNPVYYSKKGGGLVIRDNDQSEIPIVCSTDGTKYETEISYSKRPVSDPAYIGEHIIAAIKLLSGQTAKAIYDEEETKEEQTPQAADGEAEEEYDESESLAPAASLNKTSKENCPSLLKGIPIKEIANKDNLKEEVWQKQKPKGKNISVPVRSRNTISSQNRTSKVKLAENKPRGAGNDGSVLDDAAELRKTSTSQLRTQPKNQKLFYMKSIAALILKEILSKQHSNAGNEKDETSVGELKLQKTIGEEEVERTEEIADEELAKNEVVEEHEAETGAVGEQTLETDEKEEAAEEEEEEEEEDEEEEEEEEGKSLCTTKNSTTPEHIRQSTTPAKPPAILPGNQTRGNASKVAAIEGKAVVQLTKQIKVSATKSPVLRPNKPKTVLPNVARNGETSAEAGAEGNGENVEGRNDSEDEEEERCSSTTQNQPPAPPGEETTITEPPVKLRGNERTENATEVAANENSATPPASICSAQLQTETFTTETQVLETRSQVTDISLEETAAEDEKSVVTINEGKAKEAEVENERAEEKEEQVQFLSTTAKRPTPESSRKTSTTRLLTGKRKQNTRNGVSKAASTSNRTSSAKHISTKTPAKTSAAEPSVVPPSKQTTDSLSDATGREKSAGEKEEEVKAEAEAEAEAVVVKEGKAEEDNAEKEVQVNCSCTIIQASTPEPPENTTTTSKRLRGNQTTENACEGADTENNSISPTVIPAPPPPIKTFTTELQILETRSEVPERLLGKTKKEKKKHLIAKKVSVSGEAEINAEAEQVQCASAAELPTPAKPSKTTKRILEAKRTQTTRKQASIVAANRTGTPSTKNIPSPPTKTSTTKASAVPASKQITNRQREATDGENSAIENADKAEENKAEEEEEEAKEGEIEEGVVSLCTTQEPTPQPPTKTCTTKPPVLDTRSQLADNPNEERKEEDDNEDEEQRKDGEQERVDECKGKLLNNTQQRTSPPESNATETIKTSKALPSPPEDVTNTTTKTTKKTLATQLDEQTLKNASDKTGTGVSSIKHTITEVFSSALITKSLTKSRTSNKSTTTKKQRPAEQRQLKGGRSGGDLNQAQVRTSNPDDLVPPVDDGPTQSQRLCDGIPSSPSDASSSKSVQELCKETIFEEASQTWDSFWEDGKIFFLNLLKTLSEKTVDLCS